VFGLYTAAAVFLLLLGFGSAWPLPHRRLWMHFRTAEAESYNQHEYPSDTQRDRVARLLQRLLPDSLILDGATA
jgi:hypothetical protein